MFEIHLFEIWKILFPKERLKDYDQGSGIFPDSVRPRPD